MHELTPGRSSTPSGEGIRFTEKGGGPQPPNSPQFNAEFVVDAKRGNPKFIDRKRFAVCFDGPRREHSRKPDEFYDLVKRVTRGPRVDMFSRSRVMALSSTAMRSGNFVVQRRTSDDMRPPPNQLHTRRNAVSVLKAGSGVRAVIGS